MKLSVATRRRAVSVILAVLSAISACSSDGSSISKVDPPSGTPKSETSSSTPTPEPSLGTSKSELEACAEEIQTPESWEGSSRVGCGADVRLGLPELTAEVAGKWGDDTGEINNPQSLVEIYDVTGCESTKRSEIPVIGAQMAEHVSYNSDTDEESSVWQDVIVLNDEASALALWESRVALLGALASCGDSPALSESVEKLSAVKQFAGDLTSGTSLVETSTPGLATLSVTRINGENSQVAIIQAGRYYSELWLSGDPHLFESIWSAAQYRMSIEK